MYLRYSCAQDLLTIYAFIPTQQLATSTDTLESGNLLM